MAMIDVGLDEFVDNLITEKRGASVDEAKRRREARELLAIADRAVDVAIMNAVMRKAVLGEVRQREMAKLHDLIQAGVKEKTLSFVQEILPEYEEAIADELVKFKEMYISGKVPGTSR